MLIMVLFITMVIAIIGGVFSWASNNASDENKLKLSDWLVATCSVIALAGTLILSCITITQTEKANQMNDKLFKQNEDLQKINDKQFQIANQEWYPLLRPIKASVDYTKWASMQGNMWDEFWEDDERRYNGFRFGYSKNPTNAILSSKSKELRMILCLKNESKCRIKNLKLYQIALSDPYDILLDEAKEIEGLMFEGQKVWLDLGIGHYYQDFFQKENKDFYLFFEIETITGVKFYQKILVGQNSSYTQTKIETISEDKIEA